MGKRRALEMTPTALTQAPWKLADDRTLAATGAIVDLPALLLTLFCAAAAWNALFRAGQQYHRGHENRGDAHRRGGGFCIRRLRQLDATYPSQ